MNVPVKQTSNLAVISLIAGILGWTFFPLLGSVVAIITGHVARRDIRNSHGAQDGDGLALIGLILGWATVICAVLAVLAFVVFFGGLAWLGYANAH